MCEKGGVSAVIRPVGVEHLDFGDGRFSVFLNEIVLYEKQIFPGHSQRMLTKKSEEIFPCQGAKSIQMLYFHVFLRKAVKVAQNLPFSHFHRVQEIASDLLQVFRCVTGKDINGFVTDLHIEFTENQLDAVFCGFCTLIVLTGQQFQNEVRLMNKRGCVPCGLVCGGFGEHRILHIRELLVCESLDLI